MGARAKSTFLALAACTAGASLLVGCGKEDDEIKVYRVAKAPLESSPPAMPAANVPPRAAPSASVPPHWEAQAPSQMRQASYLVRGEDGAQADISFVTLGPSAGNVLDNVNRWLGQLGQPPLTDAQLPEVVQHLPGAPSHVAVVDLRGKPEQGDPAKDGRILAAMAVAEGGTAFFKMRGNETLVGAEKENFLQWVAAAHPSR